MSAQLASGGDMSLTGITSAATLILLFLQSLMDERYPFRGSYDVIKFAY